MALLDDNKANILFKHYLGTGSTRLSREFFEEAVKSSFVVRPEQLWTYAEQIPRKTTAESIEKIETIKGLSDQEIFTWYKNEKENKVNLIKKWTDLTLTKVDAGTDNSFKLLDNENNPIRNIIPFNYMDLDDENESLYNYSLKTADDNIIPFGVGDWVLDTYSGILTFYGDLPEGVSHLTPPKLSFYQYVGQLGFKEDEKNYTGAILSLVDFLWPEANSAAIYSPTLYKKVLERTSLIEKDFIATYGFDGNDTNEGVALSFEKVLPILDTKTKDPIKGYDESADQILRILLTNKKSIIEDSSIKIIFTSYFTNIGQYDLTGISLDKGYNTIYCNEEKTAFVIIESDAPKSNLNISFQVTETTAFDTTIKELGAILLYWTENEYKPVALKELKNIDFGIPVVTLDGKIPPSLLIDTNYLSQYQDTLTPDFYGPRVASYVIATNKTPNAKSSDFISRDEDNYRLNNFFAKIQDKSFSKVILREGNYVSEPHEITISSNAILEGENSYNTSLDISKITLVTAKNIVLNNLSFNANELNIVGDSQVLLVISNSTFKGLNLTEFKGKVEIRNTTIDTLIDSKTSEVSESALYITESSIKTFNTTRSNILISNSNFEEVGYNFATEAINNILLENNIIGKISASSYEKIYLNNNIIATIEGSSQKYTPKSNLDSSLKTTGRFQIYDRTDINRYTYAEFAQPFQFDQEKEIIKLLYNNEHLIIDENGKLDVTIGTEDILLKKDTTYELNETAKESETVKLVHPTFAKGTSLQEILEAIYLNKADLNDKGKVPLQQIPDAIASGGLRYVGTWNFVDEKEGIAENSYPAYSDITDRPDDKTSLQKGWFFIVNTPKGWEENPTQVQKACDEQLFTSGDWIIFEGTDDGQSDESIRQNIDGKYWTKIDRAFNDPLYSSLPLLDPSKADWYWKDNKATGGALDFAPNDENITLYKALDLINKQLRKLEPQKPSKIEALHYEIINEEELPTITYYDSVAAKEPITSIYYDNQKFNNIKLTAKLVPNNIELPKYIANTHFYFGDTAKLTATVNQDNYENDITIDTIKDTTLSKTLSAIKIPAPKEAFSDQSSPLGYWKGLSPEVSFTPQKQNTIEMSLADVVVKDSNGNSTRYSEYNGSIEPLQKVYYDFNEISGEPIITVTENANIFYKTSHTVCGNKVYYKPVEDKLEILTLKVGNLYSKNKIPYKADGILGSMQLFFGKDTEFTNKVYFTKDDLIFNEEDNEFKISKIIFDLKKENLITGQRKPIICKLSFNGFFDNKVINITKTLQENIQFDNSTDPKNRYVISLNNDKSPSDSFISSTALTDYPSSPQIQLKENSQGISVYQWPNGQVLTTTNTEVNYDEIIGEDINGAKYTSICLYLGKITEASGFTLKIETENIANMFKLNTLTGSTEGIILEALVMDNGKSTGWFNCNKVISSGNISYSFDTLKNANVLYAGKSDATTKRITFGRKLTISGDLYVRLGITKGLEFTGLKLIEVI